MAPKNPARPLFQIAKDIRQSWTKINVHAKHHLDALDFLDSINDKYYEDSAKSVVSYFLANAETFSVSAQG